MTTLKAVNAVESTVKKILSDRVTETADLAEQVEKETAAITAADTNFKRGLLSCNGDQSAAGKQPYFIGDQTERGRKA